jgi:hypothetical protein
MGAGSDLYPIISAEELATRGPFLVTHAREVETRFGTRIAFDVVTIKDAAAYVLFLGDNPARQAVVTYFENPRAERLGPCVLVKPKRAWIFRDVDDNVVTSGTTQGEIAF